MFSESCGLKQKRATLKTKEFSMEPLYYIYFLILGCNFLSNKVEGLRAEKIIYGTLARPGQFKYVVAIMYKPRHSNLPDQNPCAGSIVADFFIITVAHCFYDKATGKYRHKEYYIAISIIELWNESSMIEYYRVDFIVIPDYYEPLSLDTYNTRGDLAVVRLAVSLEEGLANKSLRQLTIPRQRFRIPSQIFTVAGYGWNEIRTSKFAELDPIRVGRTDGKLRYAEVRVIDDGICQEVLGANLTLGNMCGQIIQEPGERKGICQFDSGSPLVHSRYLTGIAINGFPECNENFMPAIYINVEHYYKFISNALNYTRTRIMRIAKLVKRNATFFEFVRV